MQVNKKHKYIIIIISLFTWYFDWESFQLTLSYICYIILKLMYYVIFFNMKWRHIVPRWRVIFLWEIIWLHSVSGAAAGGPRSDYSGGAVEATDLPSFNTVGRSFRIVTKDTVVLPCDVDNPGKSLQFLIHQFSMLFDVLFLIFKFILQVDWLTWKSRTVLSMTIVNTIFLINLTAECHHEMIESCTKRSFTDPCWKYRWYETISTQFENNAYLFLK